jgi:putative Holliday junction resolvase
MATKISVLGLDVGRKRIGVAGCDGLGLTATPLGTIHRSSFARDRAQLLTLIREREVTQLIVGLPYTMNGEIGTQAKHIQTWTKSMAKALKLPFVYVDERLTSMAAEEILSDRRQNFRRNKGLVDEQAAVIILQQWLDAQGRN